MKSKVQRLYFQVVGIRHRFDRDVLEELEEKIPLKAEIRREPKNPHDPNAIAVYIDQWPYKGAQLGYLSRGTASVIAPWMDAGRITVLSAWIVTIEPESYQAELNLQIRRKVKSQQ